MSRGGCQKRGAHRLRGESERHNLVRLSVVTIDVDSLASRVRVCANIEQVILAGGVTCGKCAEQDADYRKETRESIKALFHVTSFVRLCFRSET